MKKTNLDFSNDRKLTFDQYIEYLKREFLFEGCMFDTTKRKLRKIIKNSSKVLEKIKLEDITTLKNAKMNFDKLSERDEIIIAIKLKYLRERQTLLCYLMLNDLNGLCKYAQTKFIMDSKEAAKKYATKQLHEFILTNTKQNILQDGLDSYKYDIHKERTSLKEKDVFTEDEIKKIIDTYESTPLDE